MVRDAGPMIRGPRPDGRRLGEITPAVSQLPEQNHPTPTELREHDSQDLGGCVLYGPGLLVPGPRA